MQNNPSDAQSPPFGYLSPPIDVNDASSDDGDHLQTPLTEHNDHQPYTVLHHEQHHFSHSLFHSDEHRQPGVFNHDSTTASPETGSRSCPSFASLMTPSPAEKSTHAHSPVDTYFTPFSPPHALDLANASLDFNPFVTSYPPHVFSRDSEVFTAPKDSLDFLSNPFDSPGSSQSHTASMDFPPLPPLNTNNLGDSAASSTGSLSGQSDVFSVESDGLYMDQGRAYSHRFPAEHTLNPYFVRAYQLGDELGAGGYGFVMTAKHRIEGHEVAVKFIIKDKVPDHAWWDDEVLGRVPTEVMVMSLINHENIVKCLDLFEDDLYFYLVRDFYVLSVVSCILNVPQVQELHGTPWMCRKKKKVKQNTAPGKLVAPFPSTSAMSTPSLTPSPSTDSNVSLPATPPQVTIAVAPAITDADDNEDPTGDIPPESSQSDCGEDRVQDGPEALLEPPPTRPNFARRPSYDLFECIEQSKHKRLSENNARYIFAQVVEAVYYLDSQGITHCDVKDENIVVDGEFRVGIRRIHETPT